VSPFPRYGAAINATASKEGWIYLMGGLINGTMVKGDLWMVEMANGRMACFPIATENGPSPRVGHASMLVGNAFIVFGGDTKLEDGDVLDDTLYLLNTCKLPYSGVLVAICANDYSNKTMVSRFACWLETCRAVWAHLKHSWFQNLHIWRPSRRLLLQ
jgi:hypothetical protein